MNTFEAFDRAKKLVEDEEFFYQEIADQRDREHLAEVFRCLDRIKTRIDEENKKALASYFGELEHAFPKEEISPLEKLAEVAFQARCWPQKLLQRIGG